MGAICLMWGKMRINLEEHQSSKQTFIQFFFVVIPFMLIMKAVGCIFIWTVSIKVPEEDLSTSESCIIIPPDDEYATSRSLFRVFGVVCAYNWNANTFILTYLTDFLILIFL